MTSCLGGIAVGEMLGSCLWVSRITGPCRDDYVLDVFIISYPAYRCTRVWISHLHVCVCHLLCVFPKLMCISQNGVCLCVCEPWLCEPSTTLYLK